jgi:hypothetical protein
MASHLTSAMARMIMRGTQDPFAVALPSLVLSVPAVVVDEAIIAMAVLDGMQGPRRPRDGDSKGMVVWYHHCMQRYLLLLCVAPGASLLLTYSGGVYYTEFFVVFDPRYSNYVSIRVKLQNARA